MQKTVWQKFKESYYLDYRAMALMRIALSGILISNILIRLTDLEVFYTNQGAMPLKLLFEKEWPQYSYSFHTMSGLWGFQLFLFLSALVFGLMMLVGYRTKLATFFSWILMVSACNRNPTILQFGDDLLNITLFIAQFMPWHKRYSVDNILNKYDTNQKLHKSFTGFMYISFIAGFYIASAYFKKSPEWHEEGTALYYAFNIDQLVRPLGKWLLQFPEFLKILTQSTWYIEVLIPLLLIVPFLYRYCRVIASTLAIGLHIGIASSFLLGLFQATSIANFIGFLPSSALDYIEQKTLKIRGVLRKCFEQIINQLHLKPYSHFLENYQDKLFDYKEAIVMVFSLYLITANINSLHYFEYKLGDSIANFGSFLRIHQNGWTMFSPDIFKADGWYIYEATPINAPNDSVKYKIDLNRNGNPVDYTKPDLAIKHIKNYRWRVYTEKVTYVANNHYRFPLCAYIRDKWNKEHPEQQVGKVELIYMKEITNAPDKPYNEPTREMLCDCF